MALRHQLWLVLPLSLNSLRSSANERQFWDVLNVRFGSETVILAQFYRMAALGRVADAQPGRMTGFNDTGRSETQRRSNLNGS